MNPAAKLFEVARGFMLSNVFLACNHLGVFAAIGRGAKTAQELAAELGLDLRGLEIALLALAAEDLLLKEGESFRLPGEYVDALTPDSPRTQVSILEHTYHLIPRWAKLADTITTGRPPAADPAHSDPDELRAFICGMANVSRPASNEVADKIDLSPYRRMLDVGGGPATASIIFAQRYPQLSCVVGDLPDTIAIAKEEIEKAGMADRVGTRMLDYTKDDFGSGFDLVYISNIIHSEPPETTAMIAAKSFACLEPGGAVMIRDFFLQDDRITPKFAAMFSVNMLANTAAGKSYTLTEAMEIFAAAGFTGFDFVPLDAMDSQVLIGHKS